MLCSGSSSVGIARSRDTVLGTHVVTLCNTRNRSQFFTGGAWELVEETQPRRNVEQEVAKVKYCHIHN